MLHQKEILDWLKMFNVNQIKHFITIKNPIHQDYIKQILTYGNFKPKQRMTHGYSQQKITDSKCIYLREPFRYKSKKQQKKAVDQIFFQHITVSRSNPYSLSVSKQFIRNGKLSECMLILSDEQIFNCITAKYPHSQLGSYQDSAWFQIKSINSFSMWIVRFFELEIFEAFHAHQSIHAINHLIFAEDSIKIQKVKDLLQNIMNTHLERNRKASKVLNQAQEERLEITKQEVPYLLHKSLQKLEQSRQLCQIVFQENWCVSDPSSKVFKLYRELQSKIMAEFNEYLLDLKCQQIELLNSKKKKKKPKKTKQETTQEEQVKKQIKQEPIHCKKQQLKTSLAVQDRKNNSLFNQQKQRKIKVIKEQSQLMSIQSRQKSLKAHQNKEKQQQRKAKAIVKDRINEHILNFYEQLHQSSENFDKYRKLCIQVINSTISQLKIEGEWKLQLFGSASINFALKQSDLDLVLIVQSEKACTLKDICQLFRVKQWLRDCKILEAKVPIVAFEVLLSQIKHPKSSKKSLNSVIHVDISISYKSLPHQGLRNTNFLKDTFDNHPNLMTICLILKELLRVNKLNKPYTGGISSYVLVILAHNILKIKNVHLNESLMDQIKHISKYMAFQFEPFITLITPFKNSKIKASSQLSLNIEDPYERVLLHTSARLINQIAALFKQLHQTLQIIENEMMSVKSEERKKMKRFFFDNWKLLFHLQAQSVQN